MKFYLLVIALLFSCVGFSQKPESLTIQDVLQAQNLLSPRISDIGEHLLFNTYSGNIEQNKNEFKTWILNTESNIIEELNIEGGDIQWLPKTEDLSYVKSDDNDFAELHVATKESNYKNSKVLYRFGRAIENYEVSPDGKNVLYTVSVDAVDPQAEGTTLYEITKGSFLDYELTAQTQLWYAEINDPGPVKITNDEVSISWIGGTPTWSWDNNHIAYVIQESAPRADLLTRKLLVFNLTNSSVNILDDSGIIMNPMFLKDSDKVIYQRGDDGRFNSPKKLYVSDLNRKTARRLWSLDRDPHERMRSFPNGDALWGAADEATNSLWRGQPNGRFARLNLGKVIPDQEDLCIDSSGDVYFVGKTSSSPEELYKYAPDSKEVRKLTSINQKYETIEYGETKVIEWTTDDGIRSNGIVIYPPSYDSNTEYPLYITINSKYASHIGFDFFAHYIAAQGYIVFKPNFRGCYNQGQAYQKAVIDNALYGPTKDVEQGIKKLKSIAKINDENIHVYGHGYGGLVTLGLAINNQNIASVVVHNPITDWLDMLSLSHLNVNYQMPNLESPWTSSKTLNNYIDQSPLYHASKIKSPTLIIGTNNPYYPITNSFKLYRCLNANDVNTKFITYKGEGYYPSAPKNRLNYFQQIANWVSVK